MRNLKISRPTIYFLLVAIVAAVWFLTSEDTTQRRLATKKPTKTADSNLPEGFTEDDLKAKFSKATIAVKDAFRPIVERRRSGSETALSPNAVPSVLTGGDPNWIYTGMAEIDGVPTGLLENKSTGEAEFVTQSQRWKDCRVTAIAPFSLVLVGTNGKSYTLSIGQDGDAPPMLAQGGFAPVNPPLRGGIGAGLEVTPERPNRRNSNQGVAANTQGGIGSNEAQND